MSNYEVLLNSLLKKHKNYCIELQNNKESKKAIENNLAKTDEEIKEKEIKLEKNKNDLAELIKSKTLINEANKEYKIMLVVNLIIGFLMSIVSLAVASNYTSQLTHYLITMFTTFTITSGIAIISDTIPYLKETKPLKKILESHNAYNLKRDINSLNADLEELEDVQKSRKSKISKKEKSIIELEIKKYQLVEYINKLEIIIHGHKNNVNLNEQTINVRYHSDPVVTEILALTRKKNKKGENTYE